MAALFLYPVNSHIDSRDIGRRGRRRGSHLPAGPLAASTIGGSGDVLIVKPHATEEFSDPRGSTAARTSKDRSMTFDEFLSAEMAGLARVAGALAGDHHLAEDVLSDALLLASTRWRRIARMDHPAAYVRRMVINVYLSEHRKAQRRRTDPTAELSLLDRTSSEDPQTTVEARDTIERLLAHLTPQQRAAVVLRYLLDQTDNDIAAALSCSTSTVRSHLSHARTALRLAAIPAERG